MLIETSINDKYNKEKIAQIMLETFNIKDVYIINIAIFLINSTFKFTSIVCESGNGLTNGSYLWCLFTYSLYK